MNEPTDIEQDVGPYRADLDESPQWQQEAMTLANGIMARFAECGGMHSVQIPATLIVGVDAVLREMCYHGETSPELIVRREEGGTGATMWRAVYGGVSGWGVTPWTAMERLGNALRKDA